MPINLSVNSTQYYITEHLFNQIIVVYLHMEKTLNNHIPCIIHCCVVHGCKYGHKDCPVCLGVIRQKYLCDYCGGDAYSEQISERELRVRTDKLFIKKQRKLKLDELKAKRKKN